MCTRPRRRKTPPPTIAQASGAAPSTPLGENAHTGRPKPPAVGLGPMIKKLCPGRQIEPRNVFAPGAELEAAPHAHQVTGVQQFEVVLEPDRRPDYCLRLLNLMKVTAAWNLVDLQQPLEERDPWSGLEIQGPVLVGKPENRTAQVGRKRTFELARQGYVGSAVGNSRFEVRLQSAVSTVEPDSALDAQIAARRAEVPQVANVGEIHEIAEVA